MRTTVLFTIIFISLPFFLTAQPDTWTQKKDIGYYLTAGPTHGGSVIAGFSIGSKGYCLTSDGDLEDSDFWAYDTLTNQWSQKTDFPGTRRSYAVAFSIGTKGYYGIGFTGSTYLQDFWEYNSTTNAWTAKASFPGTARGEAVGFSIGSKGYVGLGEGAGGYFNDFWEYTPSTNVWLQRTNFPGGARKNASGTGIGTKGYVGLGLNSTSVYFNDFYEFTPSTNTWVVKSSFPGTARAKALAFTVGTECYVGLGNNGITNQSNFYRYTPGTNSWTARASYIGDANLYKTGFTIGVDFYVGFGPGNAFWKYNSGTNTWSESAQFGAENRLQPAGFSIDGKVYVCTGRSNYDLMLNDLWEWDPTTEVWTQKADFPGAARYQAVGFSIEGKGYIGMGTTTGSDVLNDFYQYDPLTNAWIARANFGGGGRRILVGFSIDNKGYAGSGTSNAVAYTNDFWEYNPTLNSWTQKANIGGNARNSAFGFSINSRGYIGGGSTASGDVDDFWEYNPATNAWIQKANVGGLMDGPSGFSVGSAGFVAGGSYVYLNHLVKYNPTTNSWSTMNNMPFGRFRGYAVSTSARAYFFGGSNNDRLLSDFWEYEAENQINLSALASNSFCRGDSIHLSYDVLFPFEAGNVFTLQVSNGSGSFSSPTNLGSVSSTTSGTISAVIPISMTTDDGYRVRIVSSLPADTSSDNGNDITVNRFERLVFNETVGTVAVTTSIATHESGNGFDNDTYTMSGTADIRNSDPSSGYPGSSGGANVYFSTSGNKYFQISGINTSGLTDLSLSFGIYKGGVSGSSDRISVEVSSDGINYSTLSYTLPGIFSGFDWYYRTPTGTIPSTSNLRIRFTQDEFLPSNTYRIDDIILTASGTGAGITASSPAYICNGSNVTLTATNGFSYLWSNSATTNPIIVNAPGSYQCILSSNNLCSASSNIILLNDTTPQQFNVTGGGSYCSVPGTGLAVGLSGSETGIKYQLLLNGITPVGGPIIGNGSAISFGLKTTVGTYTVTALDTVTSCSKLMNGSVNISIYNPSYFYADLDQDGYGSAIDSVLSCDMPPGYLANKLDCNDADSMLRPNQIWYLDMDGDGYGNGVTVVQCNRPPNGFVSSELIATTSDCIDTSATAYPGATELCNYLDDDCDGIIDEGCGILIYCVGPSASYTPPSGLSYVNQFSPFPTIQAAVAFLNSFPATQHIIFEIQNNYAGAGETFPITITYQGTPTAKALFRPRIDVPSMITIAGTGSGSLTGLIQFSGADYVTIDGTPGGFMTTTSMLRIRNTRTSGTANANILLQNDATNNFLNALTIEGGSSADGCIVIGNSSGASGNDFNSILNCTISDRSDISAPNPDIGIYCTSTGTGALANNDNNISGNKIINISDGIIFNTSGNNGAWTISNNHIYFTNSASSKISEAINVKSNEALSATISTNYIGGTGPFASGSPLVETSSTLAFNGVHINVANTSAKSYIMGNVIKNMQRNSSGFCAFDPIAVLGGPVDVLNNIIGDPNVANDLLFGSAADVLFRAIDYTSSQNATSVSISGNSINNVKIENASGTSGSFTGISYSNSFLTAATSNIADNTIRSVNYNSRGSFRCLFVSPGEAATVSANITGNKFETIQITNSLAGAFTGIYCNRANAIISGNRLGNFATPYDIIVQSTGTHYGIRLNPSSLGNGVISNDTIANLSFENTTSTNVVYGIHLNTNGTTNNEVSGNVLKNISCAGSKSSLETDPITSHVLTGIYFQSSGSGPKVISNNVIIGLKATSTSSLVYPVVSAISIGRAGNTAEIDVSGNLIHSLTNTGANTSPLPSIIGIRLKDSQSHASFVRNNMISLSNEPSSNSVKIFGVYDAIDNGIGGNLKNYFYNSIAISGTESGSAQSSAFWHNSTSSTLNLRNNIFYNTRNGGSGKHYAIVHQSGSSAAWIASASDYNNLYTSNSSTLGAWPLATDRDFAGWKMISGGDNNSVNVPAIFIEPVKDLRLDIYGNCDLDGAGIPILSTLNDIDGQIRDINTPDIGADEFNGVCSTLLNLKAFIQGYYIGGGMMISAIDSGSNAA
ncbi:MAG: hypothetical protein KA444_06495, partial [Bacteroidia bacterium]|nr:hypothetical protein [Bacteroidia bacterium]